MQEWSKEIDPGAHRRTDTLLRHLMIWLFVAGILAIGSLWAFEAHFGLVDDLCRTAYPIMIAVFIAGAAMLQRWPKTIVIARWAGFFAIVGLLCIGFTTAVRGETALVGNYPFISLLMWFPLTYAIALLMLDTRHAPWAAGAVFVFVAAASSERLFNQNSAASGDTALLVNLLASHIVLLACLGGLIRFRQALAKADSDSLHLREQASTDPLTGLANRRRGLEMLRRAAASHSAGNPSAVILCDIDEFKAINDRHGHDAGDKVVLRVASVLRNCTRNVDTVVRWGGDEFLIVVPCVSREALAELVERLRRRAADAVRLDGADAVVTPRLSAGVAARLDGETLSDWIKRADEALYQAKAGGRNRCVFAPEAAGGQSPATTSERQAVQPATEEASAACRS